MKIFNSTPSLIGNTPITELANIQKAFGLKARILAKLERTNPTGSIKDRVAKAMIDDAEARGILTKSSVIIEPTSGNTGIGLACVGSSRGYKVIIVMPDNMSEERKILMKAYGAELVLTEGAKGMQGAVEKAEAIELAKKIDAISVSVKIKVGETGKLFGALNTQAIADALKAQHGLEIDKKKIVLAEPIKSVGSYVVTVKPYAEVSAKLKVTVSAL